MSYEIIALIIFFGSLIGIGVIVFRKIPVLVELPEILPQKEERKLFLKLKEKIKILNPLKSFSYEIFLQQILSKIRILSLKSENKIGGWLQKLRERTQKKKIEENDNYWEEIKKSTKEK
ncbi:MAG: hypothetical protein COS09_02445 [Candidatus Nealsonbacteria bacterium CG01_land_8_20_14_3_00_12]|uniref:Uncharacterized protein n=3 Tax=Candidatus Nealsoniibacteriota TaxID=1817911 RepID=A0A2M7EB34_9BACT|nr:MAG: hypothetical protein COS09_02445 [Candidatus Nealsonbacteria bacterium CG01_land_8_20_14_3_00_12]PIW35279.1 MAG: hypothetical protein COW25_00475 [Candidatus Nealsonbacteria bacterium CG15_BIG_FIL_POST_REV_8_21_14_020_37_12]PJA82589.1 MAG: hypothetical protein CO146_02860 [Candidatus Nealsonbacteria bacterium CG_4_9_14_3_um_filter_37_29]